MIKIAILGPESTGKTALAQQLAEHFNAAWVPEYAREYVERLTAPYTYDDVCNIAQKQVEQEKSFDADTTDGIVFFDTELIITKVWFSYCFKTIPDFVTQQLESGFFDMYLLCEPDLPWQPDKVREHGDDRDFFFEWYKREVEQTGKPYVIVNGIGELRLQCVIKAILNQLNK